MTLLVREYQAETAKREQIVTLIATRVAARWAGDQRNNAELQTLIGSLLAKSRNGEEFNSGLSSEFEILCSVFTTASTAGDAPKTASTAPTEEKKPAEAAAQKDPAAANTGKVAAGDQNKSGQTAQQPTNLTDTIGEALDGKVNQAKAAIDGTEPNRTEPDSPKIHLDELLSYHSVMFRCEPSATGKVDGEKIKCDDARDTDDNRRQGCDCEAKVKNHLCRQSRYETAACSGNVFAEIKRRNDLVAKLHEEAKVIKADAAQTSILAAWQETRSKELKKALAQESLRGGGFYGFYAGPSFLLQDGGDWKGGTEVYANFATEAFDRDHCPWALICRSFFDASFVTPDAFPSEVEDDSTSPIAVFDSKGRLRIRGAMQAHWSDWLGMEAGIGITSPISDRSTSVRAEPRAHVGAHFQTAFPDLAVGEVFVGYARDKSWERLVDVDGDLSTLEDQRVEERFDRLILDGTLVFPRVELGGFSLGVRLSADVPWSGDTQSEIRGSILLYYPFNKELEKYRPKVKATATE